MDKDLPALAEKIGRILATRSQHFITHPAELKLLRTLSDAELREFARDYGWRVIRRVGGRQIEFYNDAGLWPNE